MKLIAWNLEKNQKLKDERGVGFEEVLVAIEEGGLLDILEHPNKGKYARQQILIVRIAAYAYLVPFIETEKEFFFKTVIPSRKATKHYIINRKK